LRSSHAQPARLRASRRCGGAGLGCARRGVNAAATPPATPPQRTTSPHSSRSTWRGRCAGSRWLAGEAGADSGWVGRARALRRSDIRPSRPVSRCVGSRRHIRVDGAANEVARQGSGRGGCRWVAHDCGSATATRRLYGVGASWPGFQRERGKSVGFLYNLTIQTSWIFAKSLIVTMNLVLAWIVRAYWVITDS